MKRIVLRPDRAPALLRCDTVKLTPEAQQTVRRLQMRTGMQARQIVSEILLQAECLVTVADGGEYDADDVEEEEG